MDISTNRQKVTDIVNYINDNFVAEELTDLHTPGMQPYGLIGQEIDEETAARYTPLTTTLTFLNSLMGKNTLLKGGSGTGKTQLSKTIGSILYQIPIEFFDLERIAGVPNATQENTIGSIDLGKLNKGEVNPYLFLALHGPLVLMDEINRYSPNGQNLIREGISSDVWKVTGNPIKIKDQIVISCMNPLGYDGVYPLNENLADNFAVQLPPATYNPCTDEEVVINSEDNLEKLLGCEELVDEIKELYTNDQTKTQDIVKAINRASEKMKDVFKERGVPHIYNGDIKEVRDEIQAQKFDPDVKLLEYMVKSEMEHSDKYGTNRYEDPKSDNSHDLNHISTKIKEPLRGRFLKDWVDLSKAISWYLNEDVVTIDSLKTAFMFTSAHRIKPEDEFFQEIYTERRIDGTSAGFEPMATEYECSRSLFESVYEQYNEWVANEESSDTMFKLRSAVRVLTGDTEGDMGEACDMLKQMDHPVGNYILKSIATNSIKDKKRKLKGQ